MVTLNPSGFFVSPGRAVSRLKIGDTADYKSALRGPFGLEHSAQVNKYYPDLYA
jgi:hypothetical protein